MDVSRQFQLSEWHHIGHKDFETECEQSLGIGLHRQCGAGQSNAIFLNHIAIG